MSGALIALLAVLGACGALLLARVAARRREGPDRAALVDLDDATSMDRDTGAVRSVQRADLVLDEQPLAAIWNPEHLERLARTYWRFLTRATLGLIRIRYTEAERFVVL